MWLLCDVSVIFYTYCGRFGWGGGNPPSKTQNQVHPFQTGVNKNTLEMSNLLTFISHFSTMSTHQCSFLIFYPTFYLQARNPGPDRKMEVYNCRLCIVPNPPKSHVRRACFSFLKAHSLVLLPNHRNRSQNCWLGVPVLMLLPCLCEHVTLPTLVFFHLWNEDNT